MNLDTSNWGKLAVFSQTGCVLMGYMELVVSLEDARAAIGRAPDFQDSRVISWGRLSQPEVSRLAALESDPTETLEVARELVGDAGWPLLTLYYADPNRGY